MNTDQRKYGSVITALHSQKALQNDQYSRTIIKANNVLSTHNFDYIKQGSNNTSDSNRTDNANEKEAESAEKNNEDESPVLSFA